MGALFTALSGVISIFMDTAASSTVYLAHPFQYVRARDHDACGEPREWVPVFWCAALRTLENMELKQRQRLTSFIEKRMVRMEAARKYSHCKSLRTQIEAYPGWDRHKLYRVYDLFKLYEMDGDGVIEVAEMSVGMDNMGDHTAIAERVRILCLFDEDKTGFIDYDEFMNMLYTLQITGGNVHTLAEHFQHVEDSYEFMKAMTAVQRLSIGIL